MTQPRRRDLAPLLEKGGKLELIRRAKLEKLDAPRWEGGARPLPGAPAPPGEPTPPPMRKF